MSENAWLIRAPGPNYLTVHQVGGIAEFHWQAERDRALVFFDAEQADLVMMAIRELKPALFGFASLLGDAYVCMRGRPS